MLFNKVLVPKKRSSKYALYPEVIKSLGVSSDFTILDGTDSVDAIQTK